VLWVARILTEDGVNDRLLGLTGNVSGDHGVHRWVDSLEALHDVESDEQTTLGVATGSDGDEDDRADDVDDSVADHAVDCLLGFGTEPSEQGLAQANMRGKLGCSPDEEVQNDLEDGEGNGNEERGGDGEVEGSVDEKRVESVETTDNEGLGEHHEEEEPSEWVGEGLPGLVGLPLFLLNTLFVFPDSFDEQYLLLLGGPFSLDGGVGQEDEDDS
jgi:hypothetical protein